MAHTETFLITLKVMKQIVIHADDENQAVMAAVDNQEMADFVRAEVEDCVECNRDGTPVE